MSKVLVLCGNIPKLFWNPINQYKIDTNDLKGLFSYDSNSFNEIIMECTDKKVKWKSLWSILQDRGLLRMKRTNRQNFTLDFGDMNDFFLPLREDGEWNTFVKITTVTPQIISPETIVQYMKTSRNLNDLFTHKGKNPEVCDVTISLARKGAKKLGAGSEGSVFHIPEWRSDVVVKEIKDVYGKNFLDDPIEGVYTGGLLTEVLSGSLTTRLLSGSEEEGFLLHLQRYVGFYSCIDDKSKYNFYMVSELATSDFKIYLDKASDLREVKVLLWQTIFSLHALNVLEFYHQDASYNNVFVKNLEPTDEFLGNNIFSAESYIYRLNGMEWTLPNVKKIAKIADFGYTTHLSNPMVFVRLADPQFRIGNSHKGAYDVSFFLRTVYYLFSRGLKVNLKPLIEEWLTLMGFDSNLGPGKDLIQAGVVTEEYRPTEKAEKWNPVDLLNGQFFSDILISKNVRKRVLAICSSSDNLRDEKVIKEIVVKTLNSEAEYFIANIDEYIRPFDPHFDAEILEGRKNPWIPRENFLRVSFSKKESLAILKKNGPYDLIIFQYCPYFIINNEAEDNLKALSTKNTLIVGYPYSEKQMSVTKNLNKIFGNPDIRTLDLTVEKNRYGVYQTKDQNKRN